MYAVVVTGGKQYRVTAGDVIDVEKLEGEAGAKVTLDQVLNLSDGTKILVGSPNVKDAVVTAEILGQIKGDKVLIFKKQRRHNYRRKNGHRQRFTTLFISDISLAGASLAKATPKKKAEQKIESTPKKEAAAKKPAAKKAAAKKE